MKKTYIQPQITIVKTVPTISILTVSNPDVGFGDGQKSTFDTHVDNSWDIWGTGDDFDEDF